MRIESGSVVFGEDWPGLFLRGDDALYHAQHLKLVLDTAERASTDPMVLAYVEMLRFNLLRKLESVHVDVVVERQHLRPARECLAGTPTLPGPPCAL